VVSVIVAVPPAQIQSFSLIKNYNLRVTLGWKAVGDDGLVGKGEQEIHTVLKSGEPKEMENFLKYNVDRRT